MLANPGVMGIMLASQSLVWWAATALGVLAVAVLVALGSRILHCALPRLLTYEKVHVRFGLQRAHPRLPPINSDDTRIFQLYFP